MVTAPRLSSGVRAWDLKGAQLQGQGPATFPLFALLAKYRPPGVEDRKPFHDFDLKRFGDAADLLAFEGVLEVVVNGMKL